MFLKLIHLNLRPGERVIKIVRQHNSKIISSLIFAFLIFLADFFLLFYFLSLGGLGLSLFGTLLILGGFYAFIKFYFWYFNALVLTTKRIIDIDQRKFFERVVSDVAYSRIKDVVVKVKGLMQSFIRSGNILLVTEGGGDNIELKNIKNPEKLRDLILNLMNDEAANPPYSPFEKGGDGGGFRNGKIRRIYDEIKDLDEETLGKIYERLPEIIKEESERSFFAHHTNQHS